MGLLSVGTCSRVCSAPACPNRSWVRSMTTLSPFSSGRISPMNLSVRLIRVEGRFEALLRDDIRVSGADALIEASVVLEDSAEGDCVRGLTS